MAKDPAILLYTGDFLNGCNCLTMEERGQYITLLCVQHQSGHFSEKTYRLLVGSISADVLKKFKQDPDGNYYNERMQSEIDKRTKFIDSKIDNGKKGGRPKKPNEKLTETYSLANENLPENDNIDDNIIKNRIKEYWEKWKNYKKDEFKFSYKSETSESEAKKELLNLSGNDLELAIKIIDQSIANGWKGFFKLNNNNHGGNGKQPAVSPERLTDIAIGLDLPNH